MITLDEQMGGATELLDVADGASITVHFTKYRFIRLVRAGTGATPTVTIGSVRGDGHSVGVLWNNSAASGDDISVVSDLNTLTILGGEYRRVDSINGQTRLTKAGSLA